MLHKRLILVFGLVLIASMVLAACAPRATPTPTPEATEPPAVVTEEPTPRHGGWLDEIVVSVVGADSAITQLQAGAIDLYGSGLASSDLPAIEAAGLKKSVEIGGTFYELTFNPYGPIFDGTGKLNPFASAKVREAVNWLVDRDYINQEVYAGGGLAKFFSIVTNYPDYADLADVARRLEAKYAYNPEKANEVITAEMTALGATLGADGKWTYNGEPVTLIFLIRTDHDGTRKPVGDYVANQLESIGFTVDRQYKTSSEASVLWVRGNVADGLWHLYTGAWGATVIDRDMGDNFQFFSTAQSAYAFTTLWQAYACGEEFETLADDLAFNRFANLAERREAFARALEIDTECALRVWLIDGASYAPFNQNVSVTYDIAAGIGNSFLWPYTIRFVDQEGGTLKYGEPDLFVDPWNPIAGSNWSYDGAVQRATQSWGVLYDPHTGLTWPQRIERAEVTVQEGLPVGVTHDWLTLDFAPEIAVPADALVDWDVEKQVFITAGELKPIIADAVSKQAEYDAKYAENQPLLETKANDLAKAADFTAFTADTVTAVVTDLAAYLKDLTGQETDVAAMLSSEDAVAAIDELVAAINSTDPVLTAEEKAQNVAEFALSYVAIADFDANLAALASRNVDTAQVKSVVYYPADLFETVKWHDGSPFSVADIMMGMIMTFDPGKEGSAIFDEAQVSTLESFLSVFKGFKIVSTDPLVIEYYSDGFQLDAEINVLTLWPFYPYGEAPWHTIAIGNLAEAAGELAYSADKAAANEIEWTSFIGGPSLELLAGQLATAAAESYIPYQATLSQYITAEEAGTRYANLAAWYNAHGNFWVGTGPYYLDKAYLTEKVASLKHFADFPDLADRWARFAEPKIADVEMDGPGQVSIGSEVTFDVFVTFQGEAYPADEIKEVKYLLYDATGAVVSVGMATVVADGQYSVVIPADVTAKLAAGANKVEVAVIPFTVAIPTFQSFEFVTAP